MLCVKEIKRSEQHYFIWLREIRMNRDQGLKNIGNRKYRVCYWAFIQIDYLDSVNKVDKWANY